MNFYNPYYYNIPMNITQPKIGLLTRIFGNAGSSIGSFINGTQKVLNIANQTIPLVKQVRPMISNAKTVFKVMNEFKKVNIPTNTNSSVSKRNITEEINDTNNLDTNISGPTFFA